MEEVKKKKTYRNFTRSEKAIVHAYVELMQKMLRAGFKVESCDLPFSHLEYAKFHNKNRAIEILEKLLTQA